MNRFSLALLGLLVIGSAKAADNAIILTPGTTPPLVTERSVDIGGGVQSPGVTIVNSAGTSLVGGGTTIPVTVSSLPLPSGASTSANQDTNFATTAHTCSIAGFSELGCLGQIDDDVRGPIAAGNNRIGTFDPANIGTWGLQTSAQNSATPTNGLTVMGQFNTSPTTVTSGNISPLQMDNAGNLLVNVKAGAGSSATFGAAFPATGTAVGMTQGGNLTALSGTSGNLNVQCSNCSGSGVSTVDAAAFTASTSLFAGTGGFFQTTATSNPLTTGQQGMFQVTATRALFTNLRNNAGAETGVAALPLQVSLANTATNATPVQVSLANTAANGTAVLVTGTAGTFPVTQTTSPWIVAGGGAAGSAASGVATVQGIASMTPLLVNPGTAANWAVGATAAAVPANAILAGGTDGTNTRAINMDTSGNVKVIGTGTAGTAASAVVTVQGVASMTPVQVSQATAASLNATVVGTGTFAVQAATTLPANVTLTDCSATVVTGGTAVNAFTAQTTLHGFTILNDDTTEVMWVSFTTTAAASTAGSYPLAPATATTFAGASSFTSPPGMGTNHALSVVAATSAHKFSCTWW